MYSIGREQFSSKAAIKKAVQRILADKETYKTGAQLPEDTTAFITDVLVHHPDWGDKSANKVGIAVHEPDMFGTRCFAMIREDGYLEDISYTWALDRMPAANGRKQKDWRQADTLNEVKRAARNEIHHQIREFAEASEKVCAIYGSPVSFGYEIDHEPPNTFDKLLFEFFHDKSINPLSVSVFSVDGVKRYFIDAKLAQAWRSYHQDNASLRVLSSIAHKTVPKIRMPWPEICQL